MERPDPSKEICFSEFERRKKVSADIAYGMDVIGNERWLQVYNGFTPENDRYYENGELLRYAHYWLSDSADVNSRALIKILLQEASGFPEEAFGYDEHTPEQRLAKGGALIAAEIDRQHTV